MPTEKLQALIDSRMKEWNELTIDEKIRRWEHVDLTLKNLSPHEKRKHFNLGEWGKKTECGTVACVAGHCGLDPYFRRQGFKLEFKFVSFHFGSKEGYWEMDNDIANDAHAFFGNEGYHLVFLGEDVKGKQTVSDARKAVQRYVKELKEQKRCEEEAFT